MDATRVEREYTDEELDREWQQTSRRPLSTIARSFSDELMDIFRIDNSISDLDQQVDNRRAKVNRNTMELASLEARLREMEALLKNSQRGAAASSNTQQQTPSHAPPSAKDDTKARSRPGTARTPQQAPSAGNMPPTPGGSEDGDRE